MNVKRRLRRDGPDSLTEKDSRPLSFAMTLREWASLTDQLVFWANADGECCDVSPNVEPTLGHPPSALIGRRLIEFEWRPDEGAGRSALESFLDRLNQGVRVSGVEVALRDAAGQCCWLRCCGGALPAPIEGPSLIILAEPLAQRRQAAEVTDADGLLEGIRRPIHSLSNTLTALACEWDLAFADGNPPQGEQPSIDKLSALIQQALEESKAITHTHAISSFNAAASQHRENHAG